MFGLAALFIEQKSLYGRTHIDRISDSSLQSGNQQSASRYPKIPFPSGSRF